MLTQLFGLHLSLTDRCNLKCLHCGVAGECGGPPSDRPELTTAEYLDLIDQAAVMGCKQLTIAGGEPLLRRDLWTLLERAGTHNIRCTLLSNGVLIDRQVAARLGQLKHLSYVRLSVDYADNIRMEAFRGIPDLTDRIFASLRMLREAGVTAGISSTIMPDNLDHIRPLALRTHDSGGNLYRAVPLLPVGRAQDMVVDLTFWAKAIRTMLNLRQELAVRSRPVPLPDDLADTGNRLLLECPAGKHVMALSAYGEVSRCSMIPAQREQPTTRDLPLSALHEHLNREQVERKAAATANRTANCGACEYKPVCRGGCYAEREVRGLAPDAPQPICFPVAWRMALEGMEQDDSLRQAVRSCVSTSLGQRAMGLPPCYRGLPVWWFPLPGTV